MRNFPAKLFSVRTVRGKGRGFTLVEVLFAIATGVVLLAAIYVAVQSAQRSSGAIESKTAAQQDVRAALEVMSLEIGMASYRLSDKSISWKSTSCGAGDQNNMGIQEATAFSITVEMDINDNGVIAGGDNEVIRYVYLGDAAHQSITRQTNCGTAQYFLGDLATNPRAVRVVNDKNSDGAYNDGTDIPVFRYYRFALVSGAIQEQQIPYNELPGAIPDIRRIDITLAVQTEGIDPNTGQRRSLVYSTSVIPRNHAIHDYRNVP